jgi:hypothetical protein
VPGEHTHQAPLSTTGTWCRLCSIMRSTTADSGSRGDAVTTRRVMTSTTGVAAWSASREASGRSM